MPFTAVSTIRHGSKNIARPGGYGSFDTSQAQQPTLDAGGVIAIIGPARNGQPSVVQEFSTLDGLAKVFSLPDQGLDIGIRFAAELAYFASADEAITGSPASVLAVKTNQDTRSSIIISSATGPLFTATSLDYGAHTNKINIDVKPGSTGGVMVIIKDGLGGTPEIGDNLGTDKVATIKYEGESLSAPLTIDASTLKIGWTYDDVGESGGEIAAWVQGPAYIRSSVAGDTYQRVTVYGIDVNGDPLSGTIKLNGTTIVTPLDAQGVALVFAKISGVRVDGVHQGSVAVSKSNVPNDFLANAVTTFAAAMLELVTGAGKLLVQTDNAGNVGKQIEIVGYDDSADYASGAGLVSELVTLGAVGVPVSTTNKFKAILRARWLSTTAPGGDIRIWDQDGANNWAAANLEIDNANQSPGFNRVRGIKIISSIPQQGDIQVSAANGAIDMVLRGLDENNQPVAERITAVSTPTGINWSVLEQIELGATLAASTFTLSGYMISQPLTLTVEDLVELLNSFACFTATGSNLERLLSQLDKVASIECLNLDAALYSKAWDVIDWVNDTSALVVAVASATPNGLPLVQAAPAFLTGGTTVASTVQNYKDAIDLLKTRRVNHIVVLSTTDAVHAYLRDHCNWAYQAGKPRQVYVPISTTTKAQIQDKTLILNSHWVDVFAQSVPEYGMDGVLRTYGPIAQACLAAGLAASVTIGEPLTWKWVNTAGKVTQTGWDPDLDCEEMLRSGLQFWENVDGRGVRVVRSITSYRKKADRILTEHSAVQSLAWSLFDLVDYLAEKLTGKRKSKVRAEVVQKLAEERLALQVKAEGIADWARVSVQKQPQATHVIYQCAPEEPNNFTSVTAVASAE